MSVRDGRAYIMRDMIYELYCGSIRPCEQRYHRDADYKALADAFSERKDWLSEHLTGEEKRRYDDILQLHASLISTEAYESFRTGFQLGVMLMTSIYGEDGGKWEDDI